MRTPGQRVVGSGLCEDMTSQFSILFFSILFTMIYPYRCLIEIRNVYFTDPVWIRVSGRNVQMFSPLYERCDVRTLSPFCTVKFN